MSEWKPGRDLRIAYSSSTGAVLLDPKTGLFSEIISGLNEHPLDTLHSEKMGKESTVEVIVACNEVSELWLLEIKRIYARLKQEHPKQKQQLSVAETAWNKHYEAQIGIINLIANQEGTLYRQLAAIERMNLARDFALNLAQWGRL